MSKDDKERVYYPKPKDFKPDSHFPKGHKKEGSHRCRAWSKTAGKQCGNAPLINEAVCRMHVGATKLKGKKNPNYKTGQYVKGYLPETYQKSFDQIMATPDLTKLNGELIVTSYAMSMILLAKVHESGDSSELWKQAQLCYKEMVKAGKMGVDGKVAFNHHLAELGEVLTQGGGMYDAMEEWRKQTNHTSKLIGDDQKRQMSIPIMQVMGLLEAVIWIYRDSVNEALPQAEADIINNNAIRRKDKLLANQRGG